MVDNMVDQNGELKWWISQWIKTIKTLILLWLIYEIDILLDDAKLFRNGDRCIKNQSFS